MKQTQLIMGMPVTVEIVDRADTKITDAVFDHFRRVDQVFSTYKPDSQISRLNRGDLTLADCSPEVQQVIKTCEGLQDQTDGYFDIHHAGQIDPSGYVKGWAVGQAAKLIETRGVANYYIEAGGDIQAGGHNPDGNPWRVGIKHPHQPAKFAKFVEFTNAAIATSGVYERGHHIYNPHTGLAAEGIESLSVIGPEIVEADVMATAAFAMGLAKGMGFIMSRKLEGYAITADRQTFATPGFNRYVVPSG